MLHDFLFFFVVSYLLLCVYMNMYILAGGGRMGPSDPPLPPLAADVNMSTIQCQLAAENICVAASQLLSLIRTLRLSLLLMDQDTIEAEEQVEVERTQALTVEALRHSVELEQQYVQLQTKRFNE
jgi:hypothetical protein